MRKEVARRLVNYQKKREERGRLWLARSAKCRRRLFPSLLDRMDLGVNKTLDGRDGLVLDRADARHAGADGPAFHDNGARAADADAAAVLGAFEAKQVAQRPRQRHLRRGIDRAELLVYIQFECHGRYLKGYVSPSAL